jgi:hypothetical protein
MSPIFSVTWNGPKNLGPSLLRPFTSSDAIGRCRSCSHAHSLTTNSSGRCLQS